MVQGQPVPLFDRLTYADPPGHTEDSSLRLYDVAQVHASILREVGLLLNTRAGHPLPADPTVLDYGLPDFGHLYAAGSFDRQTLAESVRRAIVAFEPRLLSPTVNFEPSAEFGGRAVGVVSGSIAIGPRVEPLRFAVAQRERDGDFELISPPERKLRQPGLGGGELIG